jgi:hypothetical protein
MLFATLLLATTQIGGLQVQTYDRARFGQAVTQCDRLAAYAPDRDRIAPGVARESIDLPRATRICRADLARDPQNPRLKYQLARLLDYARDTAGASALRVQAAEAGYPSALFIVGYRKAFPTAVIAAGAPGADPLTAERCAGAALIRAAALAGAFAAQVGYVSAALDGSLPVCGGAEGRAGLGAMLTAARAGAQGYSETLLVSNLMREVKLTGARVSADSIARSTAVTEVPAGPAAAPRAAKVTNANVARWLEGSYEYRNLEDGVLRGRETFLLTVHPDGSRTMRAFTDIFARDVSTNVVLRANAAFQPLEAFVSIYTQGRLKGSGLFALDGFRLRTLVAGPSGHVDRVDEVPADLSYATHPLALDGWHRWMKPTDPGREVTGNLLNVQGEADFAKPMVGKVEAVRVVYRGEELITVPAGEFRAHRFTMNGEIDLWITGPDRVLVRSTWPRYQSEYVLSRLAESASGDLLLGERR